MTSPLTPADLRLQLTQYAQDFQELLGRHNDLTQRHERLQASHSKLTDASEILGNLERSVLDLCLVINSQGNIIFASDAARTLLALDSSSPVALQKLLPQFHRPHVALMLDHMERTVDSTFEHTELILYPAGDASQARLFDVLCLSVPHESGACAYWVMRDLTGGGTAGMDSQRTFARRKNLHQGLVITNAGGEILAMDPAMCKLTGHINQDVIGQHISSLQRADKNRTFDADFWLNLEKQGHWRGESASFQQVDADTRHWLAATAIKDLTGQPVAYALALADIDRMVSAERTALDIICNDAVTGLPKLTLFQDQADERIAKAWHGGVRVTVMHIALDRLQWIKDMEGDDCAEAVLVASSARLQELVRGCDLISRSGFDKFVVLLIGPRNEADLVRIARRMIDALSLPIIVRKKKVTIGASIGCARFPQEGIDTAMLLKNAEIAMHLASKAGGNRYRIVTSQMTTGIASSENFLENEFKEALKRKELYLAYKPHITGNETGDLSACEAELRWRHPLLGDLAWQDYSAQVPKDDSDVTTGIWVLKTASEQLQQWQAMGLHDVTMVINISPAQLRSDLFTAALADTLAATQIDPNLLELTLSEAQNQMFPGIDLSYLRARRQLGIKIGIRNFSVKHADLAQGNTPPADLLKIERDFAVVKQATQSRPGGEEQFIGESFDQVTCFELQGTREEWRTKSYLKGQSMVAGTFLHWALAQNVQHDTPEETGCDA